MADDRSDEQRRWDDEEERHHWDSIEDERVAEEERQAAKKASAIETMENWFNENFEDPQIQMPRDSEDQVFLYPYGGPYEAGDILHDTFSHEFDAAWIVEAAEKITDVGTFEWAPTSTSDFYEHPEPDDEPTQAPSSPQTAALTVEILDRLAQLEAAVAALPTSPTNLGHNQPPEDIGLPPYTDEDADEISVAIVETRTALEAPVPDPVEVTRLSTRFEALRAKIGPWLAKKGDLAVDKLIEQSVSGLKWGTVLGLFGDVSGLLKKLAQILLGG